MVNDKCMKENVVKNKSFAFAVRVVKLYHYLVDKKEFVLSKQLLRSGTSVGAMVREAEPAETKAALIIKWVLPKRRSTKPSTGLSY